MNRTPVVSSNIVSIGYEAETKILEIEFKGHSIYQYFGVSEQIHKGLMNAPSHGVYFSDNIRKVGFPYEKIQ